MLVSSLNHALIFLELASVCYLHAQNQKQYRALMMYMEKTVETPSLLQIPLHFDSSKRSRRVGRLTSLYMIFVSKLRGLML